MKIIRYSSPVVEDSQAYQREYLLIYLGEVNKRAEIPSISNSVRDGESEEIRELVQQAKLGDRNAFQMLFQRYHRRAYAVALGMVKNPEDAQDIVQDAFIKAHKYLPKFQGTSSFYTWFYRIVVNRAIDHMRQHQRKRKVGYDDAIDQEVEEGAVQESLLPTMMGQDPERSLIRKRMQHHISAALDLLSENHRTVLVMRELEGMPYEKMAQVVGCSKGTIMSRLFHARRNMQKHLLGLMNEDEA